MGAAAASAAAPCNNHKWRTIMTENTTIPLNKLLAWEGNVRKTDPDKGIEELAASIAAHGLLQSLVVRKDRRGKYAVVAGRRRLLALKSLVETGNMKADREVPCTVLDDDADATEISLVENVLREAMHPADEFDAFKALIDSGVPAADVAARFGVTETVVQKRLKLARVSPALLSAYREGDMTLQHIMAFTVTDDHAQQERVWNELSEWQKNDPDNIRDMLTESEVTAADRRVKFVTLKTYEKAGGTTRRDLFSENDHGVFIDDVVLLESLVAKKLEKTANRLRKEGWKWVEVRSSFDHDEWSKCERRYPEEAPLTAESQAELDLLTAEYEALAEIEENDEAQQARMDAITERMEEIEDGPMIWPPEILAIAGAVVTLGHSGEESVYAGLVRPEDAPEKTANRKTASGKGEGFALPASLIESLTAHRSAALNAALLERPDVALAATVHAMALQAFYSGYRGDERGDSVLQIRAKVAWLDRVEGSRASEIIGAAGEDWARQIPADPADLFAWCLGLDGDTLRRLLAYCVAQTVNCVLLKADRPDSSRMEHATLLADAVDLDMKAWFTPTAASYFGRIGKAQIIDALREVKGAVAPAWSGMKRADLAALAEREIAGTGWLPEPLRTRVPEASQV
jgi:ParB family transcriptional regulator, chromosome partitioning protein